MRLGIGVKVQSCIFRGDSRINSIASCTSNRGTETKQWGPSQLRQEMWAEYIRAAGNERTRRVKESIALSDSCRSPTGFYI